MSDFATAAVKNTIQSFNMSATKQQGRKTFGDRRRSKPKVGHQLEWLEPRVMLSNGTPPVISIRAENDVVHLGKTDHFIITNRFATNAPFTVFFLVSGSAIPGIDFQDIGSSVTIPAGKTGVEIPIIPLPVPSHTASIVQILLIPKSPYALQLPIAAQIIIESNATQVASGSVHADIDGNNETVAFARVVLSQGKLQAVTYTDSDGNFSFVSSSKSTFKPGPVSLTVELESDPSGMTGEDKPVFSIEYNAETSPVAITNDPDQNPLALSNDGVIADPLEVDLTGSSQYEVLNDPASNTRLPDMVHSFDLAEPFFKFAFDGGFDGKSFILQKAMQSIPVTIHEWADSYKDGDTVKPVSSVFYVNHQIYMANSTDDSGIGNSDQPMNSEWHEASHYLQDLLGDLLSTTEDINHDGYANPDTADSFKEGWAEFWPCEYKQLATMPNPSIYYKSGGMIDISQPIQDTGRNEEYAVASLLWALTNNVASTESTRIMTPADLINLVRKPNKHPKTIADLYQDLKAAGLGQTPSDLYPGYAKLTALDDLFIERGFFADPELPYKVTATIDSQGNPHFTGQFVDSNGLQTSERPVFQLDDVVGYAANTNPLNATLGPELGLQRMFRDTEEPTKVVFSGKPTTVTAGSPISAIVTVRIEDAKGKLITFGGPNVTLQLLSGPPSATLAGTVTVQAVDGVATFSQLGLTTPGKYTLSATSPGLKSGPSFRLTVKPAPASAGLSESLFVREMSLGS